MSTTTPVIYEVTLEVDPAIAVAYDTWLEGHLRRVLEHEGFESGHVFRSDESVADGWQRRVVHYHVRSAADLERYQTVYARQDGSVAAPTAKKKSTPASRSTAVMLRPTGNTA